MIKICFITTVSITLKSFLVDTAKYLHKQGDFDITFICSTDEEFQASLPEYIRFIPIKMGRGINADGIRVIRELVKIFEKEKFDIVQYSTPNASCYAAIAAKVAKIPVRLYCQWGMAYVGFEGLKRKIFKGIEKMVCALSTWIEPDSRSNFEFSHKEGLYTAKKSSVIWNGSASGVNLDKFNIKNKEVYREEIRKQYEISQDAFVYGFVGRITRDKGINELFASMKNVLDKNPSCYLMLIGDPEITASVDMDLYRWAKEHPHVVFCGYTNNVEKYMAAMDCYVLPSYREGFGMAVVEAEAMKVPVIVTDIPGPIDAMVDNKTGKIVAKKDVASLTESMFFVQNNPEVCKQMGENGYKFAVENFEQKQLFEHIAKDRRRLVKELGK